MIYTSCPRCGAKGIRDGFHVRGQFCLCGWRRCKEPDEDGRDYIAAVLPSLRLEFTEEESNGQRSLFT
jgi:hypothetical protein